MRNPHRWRWGYKPPVGSQLDKSHSSIQSAEEFWILNEGVGAPHDLLSSKAVTALRKVNWHTDDLGLCVAFDDAQNLSVPHRASLNVETVTITIWANFGASAPGVLGEIVTKWDTSFPGSYPYALRLYANGTLGLQSYDGGNNPSAITPFSVCDGEWHCISGVRVKGVSLTVYIDGEMAANGSDTAIFGSGNASAVNVGSRGDGVSATVGMKLAGLMIHSRALSAAEMASLYADPFQMIAPPPGMRFISASGAVVFYSISDNGAAADALKDALAALSQADTAQVADSRAASGFSAEGDSGQVYDAESGLFVPVYLESGGGHDTLSGSGSAHPSQSDDLAIGNALFGAGAGLQADTTSDSSNAQIAEGDASSPDSGSSGDVLTLAELVLKFGASSAASDGLASSAQMLLADVLTDSSTLAVHALPALPDGASANDLLRLIPGAMLLPDIGGAFDVPLLPGVYLIADDIAVADSLSVVGVVAGASDSGLLNDSLSALIAASLSDVLHGSDAIAAKSSIAVSLDAVSTTFSAILVRIPGIGIAALASAQTVVDGSLFGGQII